ncbi:hypothetical protein F511_00793 [Dorcoceras hygrometricum]|nr:hypothetical protein F511_00793 [Dorcoceras hygrometricum]
MYALNHSRSRLCATLSRNYRRLSSAVGTEPPKEAIISSSIIGNQPPPPPIEAPTSPQVAGDKKNSWSLLKYGLIAAVTGGFVTAGYATYVPAKLIDMYLDLRRLTEEHVRGFTEPTSDKLLPDLHPLEQHVFTLVLDLNKTLIFSDWKRDRGWRTFKRPGVDAFLEHLAQFYEIVVYSDELSMYVDPVVERLDPKHCIRYRLSRGATRYTDGKHFRDLSMLNRDPAKVIYISGHALESCLQRENCVPVKEWQGEADDTVLLDLIPFLEYVAKHRPADIRTVLASYEGRDIAKEFLERSKEHQSNGSLSIPLLYSLLLNCYKDFDIYLLDVQEDARAKAAQSFLETLDGYHVSSVLFRCDLLDIVICCLFVPLKRDRGWRTFKRPGVDAFLEHLAQFYEIVVYSDELSMYVDPVVERLDPKHCIRYRLSRGATRYTDGKHFRDLSMLNRDPAKVIYISGHALESCLQRENCVPVKEWQGEADDTVLLDLIPFLEYVAKHRPADIRTVLASYEGRDIAKEFLERSKEHQSNGSLSIPLLYSLLLNCYKDFDIYLLDVQEDARAKAAQSFLETLDGYQLFFTSDSSLWIQRLFNFFIVCYDWFLFVFGLILFSSGSFSLQRLISNISSAVNTIDLSNTSRILQPAGILQSAGILQPTGILQPAAAGYPVARTKQRTTKRHRRTLPTTGSQPKAGQPDDWFKHRGNSSKSWYQSRHLKRSVATNQNGVAQLMSSNLLDNSRAIPAASYSSAQISRSWTTSRNIQTTTFPSRATVMLTRVDICFD